MEKKTKKDNKRQEKHEKEKPSIKVMKQIQVQDIEKQLNKEGQIETLKIVLNENLPKQKMIGENKIW